MRFSIFRSNMKVIDEHNNAYKAGKSSFWMEMNKFSDLSDAEYQRLLGYRKISKAFTSADNCTHRNASPPSSIDWRSVGAVTPVSLSLVCFVLFVFEDWRRS